MDTKNLHEILEKNINYLMSNEDNHAPSMRYLSTCIGASDSYIHKILSDGKFPSLEKLQQIANHYDIEPWLLLYDSKNKDMLSIIRLLEDCSDDLYPTILEYIKYVTSKATLPSDTDKP